MFKNAPAYQRTFVALSVLVVIVGLVKDFVNRDQSNFIQSIQDIFVGAANWINGRGAPE